MRIRRSKPTNNYVLIPNGTARDERLSYLARGVLVEILSRPDGWETNADALSERARQYRGGKRGEGRRALREAFAELEAAGYMIRRKERGPKGRIVTLMETYDTPQNRGTANGMSAPTCDDVQTPSSDRGTANGTSENHRGTANGTSATTSENTQTPRSDRRTANRPSVSGTSIRRRSTNNPPPTPTDTTAEQAGPDGGRDEQQQHPDLARAAAFLQALPSPWAPGPKTAAEYAPLLLDRARAQGWAPDAVLAAKLTERPEGIRNHVAVLHARIEDLPKAPTVPAQRPADPQTEWPPYCGDIDCDEKTRMRDIELDTGHQVVAPCPECHPNAARKGAAA